jgi:hypothetical protein
MIGDRGFHVRRRARKPGLLGQVGGAQVDRTAILNFLEAQYAILQPPGIVTDNLGAIGIIE